MCKPCTTKMFENPHRFPHRDMYVCQQYTNTARIHLVTNEIHTAQHDHVVRIQPNEFAFVRCVNVGVVVLVAIARRGHHLCTMNEYVNKTTTTGLRNACKHADAR